MDAPFTLDANESVALDDAWRTPAARRRFEAETKFRPLIADQAAEAAALADGTFAAYRDAFVAWVLASRPETP